MCSIHFCKAYFYLGGKGGGGKGGSVVIIGRSGGGAGTGGKGIVTADEVPYIGAAEVANRVLGSF